MYLFKHYSEKHNPNFTRLYWKTDRVKILDILYNKINIKQIEKLITICREKNNPCHGRWTDKPNRTPVMVRTSGVEFFVTLNTLKKTLNKRMGFKDNSKLEYYNHCIYHKYIDSVGEMKSFYDTIWTKIFRARYYDEKLTTDDIKEIESLINKD